MKTRDNTGLTPREKQVVRCLLQGQTQVQAAKTLGISPRTVANLLTNARYHTETRNSLHLLAYAVQCGAV